MFLYGFVDKPLNFNVEGHYIFIFSQVVRSGRAEIYFATDHIKDVEPWSNAKASRQRGLDIVGAIVTTKKKTWAVTLPTTTEGQRKRMSCCLSLQCFSMKTGRNTQERQ